MPTPQVDAQKIDAKGTALKNCQKLLQLIFQFNESLLHPFSFLHAFELLQRTLKCVSLEQPGSTSQKQVAALINIQSDEHYVGQKNCVQTIGI